MVVLIYHLLHPDTEADADADADPVDITVEAVPDRVCFKKPLEAYFEVMLPSVPLPAGKDGSGPPPRPIEEVLAATGVTVTVLWMMTVVVETMTEQSPPLEP